MVTVPENKPEGNLDALGAVRRCTTCRCSAKVICPVGSYAEILAYLSNYGLYGKDMQMLCDNCSVTVADCVHVKM